MPGREGNLEAVRRCVLQPMHAVSPEVVILPLLTIGNHRRSGGLKPLDSVANSCLVERIQFRVSSISISDRLEQRDRSGNTSDWLSWDFRGHDHSLSN